MVNKKGSLMDVMYIMITVFVLAIVTLISYQAYSAFVTGSEDVLSDNAKFILTKGDLTLTNFNYVFLFVLIGMTIVTIVLAFRIESHPVFFAVAIFMELILIILAVQFANIFNQLKDTQELATSSASYGVMNFIMDKLPFFILGIFVLTSLVLYAKYRATPL